MKRTLLAATLMLALAAAASAIPPQPVRQCAEWEPVEGVIIRYPLGIPWALVAEMSEDKLIYTLIIESLIYSANNNFTNSGVNMDNVRWVIAGTETHWTRDWGPQCIFDGNGDWGIGDPLFDGYPWVPRGGRDHELDDGANAVFADYLGEPCWTAPIVLTGGNHMTDGHHFGLCTEAQRDENLDWGISEAEWRQGLLEYFGIENEYVLPNYEGYGIQHIDCVAKFLDEETILVKKVSTGHGDHAAIEVLVDSLRTLTSCYGNPYKIVRVDCGPHGSTTGCYTNSLILGKKMLVPQVGIPYDALALTTIQNAMPGYEVIGFTGSWYYYDALHCRTMGIFDRGMLYVDVTPPPAEIPFAPWPVRALIDDRSEAGLDYSQCSLLWRRAGDVLFNEVTMTPLAAPDSLEAFIPPTLPGGEIEYYVRGADLSGRVETRPVAAPDALFRTAFSSDLTAVDVSLEALRLVAWPNPFRSTVHLSLGERSGPVEVQIFDVTGRCVRTLQIDGAGSWDGRDGGGMEVSAGLYFLRCRSGRAQIKVLKVD